MGEDIILEYINEVTMGNTAYAIFHYKGCTIFIPEEAPIGQIEPTKVLIDSMDEVPSTIVCSESGVRIDNTTNLTYDRLCGIFCGLSIGQCASPLSIADFIEAPPEG